MILNFTQPPSIELYLCVRAGFILRNKTLLNWCREEGTSASYMKQVLMGVVNGKKSIALRKKVIADVQKLNMGGVK